MTELLAVPEPLSRHYSGVICDLDGVVFTGTKPVAGAAEAISQARGNGLAFVFLTNNASRSPATVVSKLEGFGIAAAAEEVVTAAHGGAALLLSADLPKGAKVLVVGTKALVQAIEAAGFESVTVASEKPLAVIQGWGPEVGWADLAEATYAIRAGAAYYATNLDKTLPTESGFAPGNGSLVAAVSTATGVTPKASGKPNREFLELAAKRLDTDSVLVVGDRLDTDIAGAKAAGLPGLLVLTGVSSLTEACLAPPEQRPDLISSSLTALGQPTKPAQQHQGRWLLGDSVAWFDQASGRIEAIQGSNLDQALAVTAQAAWQAVDQGHHLTSAGIPNLT
ncbi:MAG: HAD-IIA family hydrolase [Micrococcales bacterium]|nr:HAD-IIA family hydrolase [Micrococcales bacterium]